MSRLRGRICYLRQHGTEPQGCSRNWAAMGSCLRGREVLGARGVSEGNGSSSQMFVPPPTSAVSAHFIARTARAEHQQLSPPGLASRSTLRNTEYTAQGLNTPTNTPSSQKRNVKQNTKTQGDNEICASIYINWKNQDENYGFDGKNK